MIFKGVSISNSFSNVKHIRFLQTERECLLTTRRGVEIARFSDEKKARNWWSCFTQHRGGAPGRKHISSVKSQRVQIRQAHRLVVPAAKSVGVKVKNQGMASSHGYQFVSNTFCFACQGSGGVNGNCFKCYGSGWA